MPTAPVYHAPCEPGDLFACWGTSVTSLCISSVTASCLAPDGLRLGPSHVAIAAKVLGAVSWFESTTLCDHPCRLMNTTINGVQCHLPEDRINDYLSEGGRVVQYRPVHLFRFTPEEQDTLATELGALCGREYDYTGAACSGSRVFQLSRLFPAADLNHLFCSELVAALLMRTGRMPVANATRFNPARLMRQLVTSGVYQKVNQWSA